MNNIPDGSFDMILCDLPYGTTNYSWDICLPLDQLWGEYWRISKENAPVILTAQQPFATRLVMSAMKFFRYEIIWEKPVAMGFLNARKMPLRAHENILVFYRKLPKYRPQMTQGKPKSVNGRTCRETGTINLGLRYPRSVIRFGKKGHSGHPTEKPLSLFEWLVKTYTDIGDFVLDNCVGSSTTAVACEKLGRRWVGIEKEELYFEIARKRLIELLPEEREE